MTVALLEVFHGLEAHLRNLATPAMSRVMNVERESAGGLREGPPVLLCQGARLPSERLFRWHSFARQFADVAHPLPVATAGDLHARDTGDSESFFRSRRE